MQRSAQKPPLATGSSWPGPPARRHHRQQSLAGASLSAMVRRPVTARKRVPCHLRTSRSLAHARHGASHEGRLSRGGTGPIRGGDEHRSGGGGARSALRDHYCGPLSERSGRRARSELGPHAPGARSAMESARRDDRPLGPAPPRLSRPSCDAPRRAWVGPREVRKWPGTRFHAVTGRRTIALGDAPASSC